MRSIVTAVFLEPVPFAVRWPRAQSSMPHDLAAHLGAVHPDDRAAFELAVVSVCESPGEFAIVHRVIEGRVLLWVGRALVEPDLLTMDGHLVDITEEQTRATESLVIEAVQASDAHRSSIERAKGIVMAEHHVGEAEAFLALRHSSNETNTKLRMVAERIVQARTSRGIVGAPVPRRDDTSDTATEGRA